VRHPKSGVPRLWAFLIVAVVLFAPVAIEVVATSSVREPNRAVTVDRGVTHPGLIAGPRTGRPARVERVTSWLEGLATGTILPSDVSGRLQQQDPQLARAVMAAWVNLQR